MSDIWIGGCILSGEGRVPAEAFWTYWIELLLRMGWDGRATV